MIDRPVSIDEDEQGGGFGSLGTSMGLLVVAWGALIASFPLNDNSFFTHLATGRIILDEGSVPSSDPYTFTAQGVDWTVQSWLASVAYAAAERVGGAMGLRVLVLAVFICAALLLWRMTRPARSIFSRLAVAFGALFVFTGLWAERPYMVGVIGLAIVWLALEGAVRAWLLVPLLWVWANSHGSYPLALVLVLAVLAGEVLDRRSNREEGERSDLRTDLGAELAVLKATVVGTLVAMIGPLGIDVLVFPFKAVTQSDVLSEIIEWQSPGFRSLPERAFLLLALATMAGLVRNGRWRLAIPTLLFAGSAIVAQRNVVLATMVLVPVLAACVPSVGSLTARTRPGLGTAFTTFSAVAAIVAGLTAVSGPAWGLDGYPMRSLAWMEANGISDGTVHVATQDLTGNLVGLLDGPAGTVFIDDRADMFPADVFGGYVELVDGGPEWAAILDTYDIDVVVWDRSEPMGSLLAADPRWRTMFTDTTWVVSCRRDSDVCAGFTA